MKAIILAAGYATRLYPLTKDRPKALLPINEKKILDFIVDEIETIPEVDELIVVSNHKFVPHFTEWAEERTTRFPVKVLDDNTTDDTNKLGAVGDMAYAIREENIDDDILVMAGDNIFTFPLLDYFDYFKKKDSDCILIKRLEKLEDLQRMANAVLDENDRVTFMEEKPKEPKTNNAVFASYFYKKETLPLIQQYLDEGNNPDAPGFFPSWLYAKKPVHAFAFEGECYDIGTHESYKEVQEIFK